MYVDTPHGIAQALFLIDYGIHQNTIWVCANVETGAIKHYNSNQLTLCPNYTIDFNTEGKKHYGKKGTKTKGKVTQ